MADKTSKGNLPFPSSTDLNHRLRKVVTTYQKLYKKELLRQEQREKVNYSYITFIFDIDG